MGQPLSFPLYSVRYRIYFASSLSWRQKEQPSSRSASCQHSRASEDLDRPHVYWEVQAGQEVVTPADVPSLTGPGDSAPISEIAPRPFCSSLFFHMSPCMHLLTRSCLLVL